MGIESKINPAAPQDAGAEIPPSGPSQNPSPFPRASIVISTPLPPRKAAGAPLGPTSRGPRGSTSSPCATIPTRSATPSRSGDYPYRSKVTEAHYVERMLPLQAELLKAQNWVKESGEKIVILFEGRDAAGKGGTIKRFMEHLNPRGARIVALEKPNERERTQWYFQRYVNHLPAAGEIVFFDRSWYNRAGVERVMGFCKPNEYLEFMRQCPEVERMLVRSGIRLYKYWFSVTREEQRRRFCGARDRSA